jgi:hypothetical protein
MKIFSDGNGKIKEIHRKIPKAVPFILLNILLERYSTTGISGELNESDSLNL